MLARFATTGTVLLLAAGCASGPQVGSRAPAFEAIDSMDDEVSLASYEGQVLILDFFGVW